ncbi:MAG: sn-glycerol-3-phosphate ABC transporter ATP-binding protein UgpC [Burkholderiales bacterium]|jgi:multiple sugar transport system ATP-binding protein|nr:sn-glycerol-3-phosphate ABC transporter ATP-binding protein UgpC [Burkholderiales bacterium]
MTHLTLKGVEKQYGTGPRVLHGIDLHVESGEFMVFVGPSGCGKTTLLRSIAGLEDITAGQIFIGDEESQNLPPVNRGVAMVFQSYALYPHMTVAENIGFALKFTKLSKAEVHKAVMRAAEVLQIVPLLDRKPKALSGGQRQRVAIGRAIVRHPKVFLFDEPLSNLDAALRVQMRMELSKLHRDLGTTMIYVTHDQVEAMTLGTRIAVFNAGRIEQVGSPMELYRNPKTRFVAGFLGSPKMCFLPGMAHDEGSGLRLSMGDAGSVFLPDQSLPGGAREVTLGVRPEHFGFAPPGSGFKATVDQVEHLGDCDIAYAYVAGHPEPAAVKLASGAHMLSAGEVVWLRPESGHCHLFDSEGRVVNAR